MLRCCWPDCGDVASERRLPIDLSNHLPELLTCLSCVGRTDEVTTGLYFTVQLADEE